MNKEEARGGKNLKERTKENAAPKPKENAQSSIKVPPRKYGAHAGIKFNFTFKKDPTGKLLSFDTRTEKEKRNFSSISRKSLEKQASKDRNIKSVDEVEKCMENLKISKTPDDAANVYQRTGDASHCAVFLSENEHTCSCSNVVKSSDVINLLAQAPKSKIPGKMKSPLTSQASSDLKLRSSTFVETPQKCAKLQHISKIQPPKLSKPQTSVTETDAKVLRKKYGEHAGLKFKPKKQTTIVQPFNFGNRASKAKNKSVDTDGVQTTSKVECTTHRSTPGK